MYNIHSNVHSANLLQIGNIQFARHFYSGPPLLTTDCCSRGCGGDHFAQLWPHLLAANKNKLARTSFDNFGPLYVLQTFLPSLFVRTYFIIFDRPQILILIAVVLLRQIWRVFSFYKSWLHLSYGTTSNGSDSLIAEVQRLTVVVKRHRRYNVFNLNSMFLWIFIYMDDITIYIQPREVACLTQKQFPRSIHPPRIKFIEL